MSFPRSPSAASRARCRWVLLAALFLASAACAQMSAPPDSIDRVERYDGVVRLYLINEFGDVEGVVAQDGTQVRFPPHMGPDLVRALKPGDRFVAQGRGQTGRGFRAYAIGREGATPIVEARPSVDAGPPRPPEERAAALAAMHVEGVVANLLYGPRGEVDGVVLGDGTIVRLPPRSDVVDPTSLQVGSKLAASGYGTKNTYGSCLRAERVGVNGQAMVALQPRGPAAPRPPTPPR